MTLIIYVILSITISAFLGSIWTHKNWFNLFIKMQFIGMSFFGTYLLFGLLQWKGFP